MFNKQCDAVEKHDPPSIIPRLKEITNELMRNPMTQVFKTVGGKDSIVRSLMARNTIGVVDASIPEGEMFPEHVHDEPAVEYLIVYTGRVAVFCLDTGDVQERGPGEVCRIPHGARHLVEAIAGHGDVRLVGITIPRDPDYPGELEE